MKQQVDTVCGSWKDHLQDFITISIEVINFDEAFEWNHHNETKS